MDVEKIKRYCADCGMELEIIETLSPDELEQMLHFERLHPACRAFVSGLYCARARDLADLDAEIMAHNRDRGLAV